MIDIQKGVLLIIRISNSMYEYMPWQEHVPGAKAAHGEGKHHSDIRTMIVVPSLGITMHQALSFVFHLCLKAHSLPVRTVLLPFHRRKPCFRELLPKQRHKWKLPSHPPLIISPEKRVTKARVSGTRALPGEHSLLVLQPVQSLAVWEPLGWAWARAGPNSSSRHLSPPVGGTECQASVHTYTVTIVKKGGHARPETDPVQEDLGLHPCLVLPSQHLRFEERLEGRGEVSRGGGNCACY